MSPTWVRMLLLGAMCFIGTSVVENGGELKIPLVRRRYDVSIINGCYNRNITGSCTHTIGEATTFDRFVLINRNDTKQWYFNVTRNTRITYYCTLSKGLKYYRDIVLFNQIRDKDMCGWRKVCRYNASNDGIYFRGGMSRWALVANWTGPSVR